MEPDFGLLPPVDEVADLSFDEHEIAVHKFGIHDPEKQIVEALLELQRLIDAANKVATALIAVGTAAEDAAVSYRSLFPKDDRRE